MTLLLDSTSLLNYLFVLIEQFIFVLDVGESRSHIAESSISVLELRELLFQVVDDLFSVLNSSSSRTVSTLVSTSGWGHHGLSVDSYFFLVAWCAVHLGLSSFLDFMLFGLLSDACVLGLIYNRDYHPSAKSTIKRLL